MVDRIRQQRMYIAKRQVRLYYKSVTGWTAHDTVIQQWCYDNYNDTVRALVEEVFKYGGYKRLQNMLANQNILNKELTNEAE